MGAGRCLWIIFQSDGKANTNIQITIIFKRIQAQARTREVAGMPMTG
jgi:hypothetical protein